MKQTKPAPAPTKAPTGTPLERMRDLTRRVIAVPKAEVLKSKRAKRK